MDFIKKNKEKEIVLYIIFGILTTIINILVYTHLTEQISINYLLSNFIAWTISVLFAFITNKIFVFKSKTGLKNTFKEAFYFILARIASLFIDMILIYIFIDILFFNNFISKIISNFIVVVSNYIFSKVFIFKKNKYLNTK